MTIQVSKVTTSVDINIKGIGIDVDYLPVNILPTEAIGLYANREVMDTIETSVNVNIDDIYVSNAFVDTTSTIVSATNLPIDMNEIYVGSIFVGDMINSSSPVSTSMYANRKVMDTIETSVNVNIDDIYVDNAFVDTPSTIVSATNLPIDMNEIYVGSIFVGDMINSSSQVSTSMYVNSEVMDTIETSVNVNIDDIYVDNAFVDTPSTIVSDVVLPIDMNEIHVGSIFVGDMINSSSQVSTSMYVNRVEMDTIETTVNVNIDDIYVDNAFVDTSDTIVSDVVLPIDMNEICVSNNDDLTAGNYQSTTTVLLIYSDGITESYESHVDNINNVLVNDVIFFHISTITLPIVTDSVGLVTMDINHPKVYNTDIIINKDMPYFSGSIMSSAEASIYAEFAGVLDTNRMIEFNSTLPIVTDSVGLVTMDINHPKVYNTNVIINKDMPYFSGSIMSSAEASIYAEFAGVLDTNRMIEFNSTLPIVTDSVGLVTMDINHPKVYNTNVIINKDIPYFSGSIISSTGTSTYAEFAGVLDTNRMIEFNSTLPIVTDSVGLVTMDINHSKVYNTDIIINKDIPHFSGSSCNAMTISLISTEDSVILGYMKRNGIEFVYEVDDINIEEVIPTSPTTPTTDLPIQRWS